MFQTRRLDAFYRGETWREDYEIRNEENELIDLTGTSFTIRIIPIDGINYVPDDYYDDCYMNASLSGSTTGGEITTVGLGTIEWVFSSEQTASLRGGDYRGRITSVRYGITTVISDFQITVL